MAAPAMTRPLACLPPLSDAESSVLSLITSSPPPSPPPPPSSPPLSDGFPKNPWRINPCGGATAAAGGGGSVTLMGEPSSSWPPLCSSQRQRRSDSPPNPPPGEIDPSTAALEAEKPGAIVDLPSASSSSLSSSSSSSSSEIASHEETAPPTTGSPAMTATTPASSPPPLTPAPVLPPSPSNATAANHPRPPLRPAAPPHRRGRNQRFHHHRGGGSPRYNSGYSNRSPNVGWRPNWSFNSSPQYPHWGFYHGPAVNVVPPAEVNSYLVPYPQPYNELFYADYGAESYATYYNQPAYEIPYAPSVSLPIAGLPPPHVGTSFAGVASWDHQAETLKDQLLSQIEYYFSDDNLVKDTYLKRQMDTEGWVDIHKIAGFRRVAALSEDINLIKDALQSSNVVEIQGDKMRKRHGWHKWILQVSPQNSLVASMGSIQLNDQ